MPQTAYNNYINHAGMPVEQVKAVDLKCRRYEQNAEKFWEQFFDKGTWEKGHKTFTHRKHIRPEVTLSVVNAMKLAEGYGAVKSNIKVVDWEESVDNFGAYVPYTREAIQYNIDNVVGMAENDFKYKMVLVPEIARANAICTSNFQMTPVTTNNAVDWFATFNKAKVILTKKKSLKFKGTFLAIITPEIEGDLKNYLHSKGESLDEITKEDITREGTIYKWNGFTLTVRSDEAMYSNTDSKIVFIVRTEDGELPGSEITAEFEIYDKGLGSGLIQTKDSTDASPVYEADTNNREGTVALNIDHFGASIQADLAHLVCVVETTNYSTGVTYPTADPINGITNTSVAPVIASGTETTDDTETTGGDETDAGTGTGE